MKRFWKDVSVADRSVLLDGKPLRTPAKAPLVLPTDALAAAIGEEWHTAGEQVDPRAMPLTGLANAAIDRVAPIRAAFAADLAKYGESDVLCYRAELPVELAARQEAAWTPLLDWAHRRYDIAFTLVTGVIHRAQPPETVARLGQALAARDAFELAALSPLVTIGGSLVAALMLAESVTDAAAAFDATHLDELWQAELWGEDWMAADARTLRRADFVAAARFLTLL